MKRSSTEICLDAIKLILPFKISNKRLLAIIGTMSIPSFIIAFSPETVSAFVNSVETFNTVIVGIFGIVFMGYAFFQALINDELLIRLINTTNDDEKKNGSGKSKLQESNEYFAKVMMLDIMAIMINIFIIITIGSLKNDFYLPFNQFLNETVAFSAILIYFYFVANVVWEMKCFVFNLFQLFNSHAGTKAIEYIDKEN